MLYQKKCENKLKYIKLNINANISVITNIKYKYNLSFKV